MEVDSESISCKPNVGNQKEGSWNIMVTECDKKMKKIGNELTTFCYKKGYYVVEMTSKFLIVLCLTNVVITI